MKIEDLYTLWEHDSIIKFTELGKESLNVAHLHSKYLNLYSKERLILRKLESDFKITNKLKFEYYTGTLSEDIRKEKNWLPNPLKILRQDLGLYLEADYDLKNESLKIVLQKEKVDYLEQVVKHISGRGYLISSAINYEKFMAGG